jgi:hypothetical protein
VGYYELLKLGEKIMKPIRLEIVTKVITLFDTCRRCQVIFGQAGLDKKIHQKEMEEYPPDLKEEYMRLSDWIRELSRLYKHRLRIKLIDVQSPLGIYKSLRHRIRTYPGFIVEGKETYIGWDKSQLENLLDKYIQSSLPSKQRSFQPSLS